MNSLVISTSLDISTPKLNNFGHFEFRRHKFGHFDVKSLVISTSKVMSFPRRKKGRQDVKSGAFYWIVTSPTPKR